MPYIKTEDRQAIHEKLTVHGVDTVLENAGEVNYAITSLVDNYLQYNTRCYRTINEMIGALECAKLELYRRVAAPYEDTKIIYNGDAYTENNTK